MGDSSKFQGKHGGQRDEADDEAREPKIFDSKPRGLWQQLDGREPEPRERPRGMWNLINARAEEQVQRKASGEATAQDPSAVATAGVQSANERMPHHDQIQASFGRHDISGVRAQTGGGAAEASRGLGASAYAVGNRVGFAQSPDLHTAAHEAAHVVQQQAGVQLKGGIDGGKDDSHEQHADAVADKVVRGESAEGLLDTMSPSKSGAAASPAPVQRKGKVPTASELRKQLHEYLVPNSNVVWREFHPYITSTMFAQPNPRLHWGNDRAFNELLFRQLSQYIDVGNIAQLDELLYPSNAVKALSGLIPGTTDWSVEFGLALFHELHIAISGSIQRMGERLVAYADSTGISGEVEINTNDLVTSVPMDRYVGPALCFRGTVVVSELPAKAAKAAKGKPTGLRAVHVTWQSGELWNWVKADPADASAEEVAATLFRVTDNHGDYMASFNAYMLAAAPPLFGVPKRFAIQNKNAKAPPNALAGDDSVNRQLMTLASGSAADESALHEDAPGKQPTDPKAAGAPVLGAEYTAVSDAITDVLLQLRFAEKQATPWGFATLVAPAIKFLMHKDGELKHADPARLADWLQLFQNQKDRVSRIAGGINDLVGSAKKLGITDPKAPQAGPAREIFEQFAMAAGLSHLAQPSEANLAEGLRLQSTLAVRALQSTEGDMMGAIQEANQRTGGDDKFMRQMSHEAGDLQDRSRKLQMQMVNGKEVDQNEYDDVALKSEEVALLSRLQGLRVELAHLNNAADAAGKGDAAIIASLFSGKFRNLKHLSAHIFGEFQPVYSHIRSLHDDYAKNEKAGIYNDPKYKAQERAQRRVELANAKRKFQDVSADPDVVDFFKTAATTIQNQQFRTAIVQTAAMIGISIVAGAVAGLAARAVGGVLLEAAGVEAVTDLGVVARTGIGAAKVATQIGVDTTINSAGAAAIQGRDFTEVWKENLIVGLASTALFGSISRYGQAVAQREAEIASLEGRVIEAPVAVTWAKATAGQRTVMALKETGAISAHTLWGIAVGEVAGRIVTGKTSPPPETLRDWALQGISVAVGRHVQERVISHSEMYKALEVRAEDGGRALTATAKNLTAMAQEVITSKNAKRAAELLAEHDEFLRNEIAEIDKAIAKHGDHTGELFEARRNLELAAAAAGDDGMLGTKMTLLGMEELVPGALWKGTKDQIEHALATQKNPPPKVTHEGARWRVQLGERVIEIQEVASAQKTVDVERVVLAGSDEEVRLAAKIVPPEPGMLDVVVHGSIDDFMVTVNGRDISIDHRAMAKFIEKSGMKCERVRLLSCKAGMHPKGVAQHLANKLGVPVLAPTEKLYIHPDGKMTVGPSETRDLGSAGWQEFKPQKSGFRYEKAPETPIETTRQTPKEKAPVEVEEREPSATAEKGRAKELGRVPKPPRSGPADASEVDHAEKGDFTDGGKLQGGGHGHGNVAELKARGYEELPAAEVMRLRAQQEPYETKYREWKAQDEAESTWKNARDEFRKGLGDAKELGKLRNPKLGVEEKMRLEALKRFAMIR